MINGIINVYKEPGYTSHDVVAKLRGILHMKKIGHTGTLDPAAAGVLPVCLGKGTRLCDMITDWGKTYEAVMLLGVATDTQDTTGKILSQCEAAADERTVMEAINSFVGEYDQIPPMYSALKHNGRKLYELAREGIEVERRPRRVQIHSIRIHEMNLKDAEQTVTFTVSCSKGTYIRTLCDDIGRKLGCGACMKSLKRTRVGNFTVDESLTLNQISALMLKGELEPHILSIDQMFEYPKVVVGQAYEKLLYNGNRFPREAVLAQANGTAQLSAEDEAMWVNLEKYRVYDEEKHFVGIYRYEYGSFIPVKMFLDKEIN